MKGGRSESSAGLRQFFQWLESRYGGLPLDTGKAAEVIVNTKLCGKDLQRLMAHEATALHVKNFYPRASAQELGLQMAQQTKQGQGRNWKVSTSRGLESSDVFTLGAHAPYNVASGNGTTKEYFQGVQDELKSRRVDKNKHALPLWPLDKVRLELDEVWAAGAGLAKDETSKMPFGGGLPRIMMGPTRWKKGFIHVDEMAPLSSTTGLFSANVYLQLPDNAKTDGVFQIWPVGIRSRWDWYRVRILVESFSQLDPALLAISCIVHIGLSLSLFFYCFGCISECNIIIGTLVSRSRMANEIAKAIRRTSYDSHRTRRFGLALCPASACGHWLSGWSSRLAPMFRPTHGASKPTID